MGVHIGDVRLGKCFVSRGAKPRVVRVLAVSDGLVRFETRAKRNTWSGRTEQDLFAFAAELAREVGSDFEPSGLPRLHI